jgi:RNA polymerase sigma-70 factor (ECF subfamily)
MDDAELVRQVLTGNLGAYGELVTRYTAMVAAVCRAHLSRSHDVDDVVQETWCRGLARLAELRKPARFAYWVTSIARHLCCNWLRDPNHRHLPLEATPSLPASPESVDEDDRADRVARLRVCIRQLPVELQEILNIYYSGGRITYQEIADCLGTSYAHVNRLLTQARRALKACMEGDTPTSMPA